MTKTFKMNGAVTTIMPDRLIVTRQVPTFEVDADSAREALTKYRDIVTACWRGPCKMEFHVAMCDQAGNFFKGDNEGMHDD